MLKWVKETRTVPYASSPNTDEKIGWANLKIKHDGGINRHEKIFALEKYLKQSGIQLRVCGQIKKVLNTNSLNCSRCEKCQRTITTLILAGIDPNKCGFRVDDSTFELVKNLFKQKKISPNLVIKFWKPVQSIIPQKLERSLWLKKFLRMVQNSSSQCSSKTIF